jgi:hypothetical protein
MGHWNPGGRDERGAERPHWTDGPDPGTVRGLPAGDPVLRATFEQPFPSACSSAGYTGAHGSECRTPGDG